MQWGFGVQHPDPEARLVLVYPAFVDGVHQNLKMIPQILRHLAQTLLRHLTWISKSL